MRIRSRTSGAIAIAGVLAGVLVAGASASTAATSSPAGPAPPRLVCTLKIYNQTPTKLSGFSFGFIKCSAPFGNGVQSSTYHATVNPQTGAATNRGSYKNWFDTGTAFGTFSLTGRYTSPTTATFKGTVTVAGGTGAFVGATGIGKLTCRTTDAGATSTCTAVFK